MSRRPRSIASALVAFREVEDALGHARAYAEQAAAQERALESARRTSAYFEQRLRGGWSAGVETTVPRLPHRERQARGAAFKSARFYGPAAIGFGTQRTLMRALRNSR